VLEDLKEIVDIYNSTVPEYTSTADTQLITVESRYEWYRQHSPHRRPLWIAEANHNDVIGWVSLQDFYGRPAYGLTAEISIYLSPNWRGKGYGKLILTHCIKGATNLGIKNLIGFIFSHNVSSIRLFESQGFECWGCLPNIAVLNDIERSLKIFGKHLDLNSSHSL